MINCAPEHFASGVFIPNKMTPKNWKFVKSRKIADCRVFKILGETFEHPNGRRDEFYINKSSDWVQCAAIVNDGGKQKVILVNQFRFGARKTSWEFSGGIIDNGETPVQAAKRELLEETGYAGKRAKLIASYSPNPAIQNNLAHIVVIEDCKKIADVNWDANEEIEMKLVDIDSLDKWVSSKKIFHCIAINVVYFLQKYLAKKKTNATK